MMKDPGSLLSFSGLTFYGGLICAAVLLRYMLESMGLHSGTWLTLLPLH